MEEIICHRCGSVDDYKVVPSGPHLKAICKGCGKYIKFISKQSIKTNMNNQSWGAPPAQSAQQNNNRPMPEGIRFFNKHQNAPDFVLASLVITPAELFDFLKNNPTLMADYQGKKQLKLQILRSKDGKIYSVVDTYGTPAHQQQQPDPAPGWGVPPPQQPAQQQPQFKPDDLPF